MTQNMGSTDRIVRILIGIVAAYIGYTSAGTMMWVGYGVGAIMILTSLVGFCPLYVPFKLSTLKK